MPEERSTARPTSKNPPRIASLISSATEILFGLGLGDQVVAVSHECDWPPEVKKLPQVTSSRINDDASSGEIDDEVQQLMATGAPLYDLDREQLESLAPDLIVTQAQCDVCAVRYDDVVELVNSSPRLADTKIVSLAPESLDDLFDDIRRVGEATECEVTGTSDAAEQYVDQLQARLKAVRESIGQVSALDRPRVAIVEWLDPIMIAGNWTPGMVVRAGGRYDLAEDGRHSPYVDWSKIVAYDPEVLFIAPCGFDIDRTKSECHRVTSRTGWQQLSAVRAGRVFILDGNAYLNRSGPRLVDTVEILAHLIHPDRCGLPVCVGESQQAWRLFDAAAQ